MQTPPPLTDQTALMRNRDRARRMGTRAADTLFLQNNMANEVHERLTEINRRFTDPAVVTPFREVWQDRLPGARLVPDAEVLDLAEGAHDLVVHGLALHWANDPVGQLVQCRRALRPDGLLIATLFGGRTLTELRACLATAEAEVTGGLSPRIAPMGEIRDLGGLLQRAGFAMPVADSTPLSVEYGSALALMADLRAMGEANALAGRLRYPTRRTVLLRAAALYAERFAGAGGRIIATFEVVTLSGWAPAAGQPQPLRPGSATHRLADALGTREAHPERPGD